MHAPGLAMLSAAFGSLLRQPWRQAVDLEVAIQALQREVAQDRRGMRLLKFRFPFSAPRERFVTGVSLGPSPGRAQFRAGLLLSHMSRCGGQGKYFGFNFPNIEKL